jgi:lysophospholipase
MTVTDAAPLLAPSQALPGGTAEWVAGAGGLRLRAALFPAENPRGSVVLSGGRTEFIEKYYEVIGELNARGFTVMTHDWRGQGLSDRLLPERLKGHAEGFDDFATDYGLLLDRFSDRLPGPRIAVSHSMGGCLTALALARGERRIDGALLSSPMLGLQAQRPWPARVLAAAMMKLGAARSYTIGGKGDPYAGTFEKDRMTHDRARWDRSRAMIVADPDLALGGVTWGWVASAFSALDRLHASPSPAAAIAMPFTILGAGADVLIDNVRQRQVADAIPGCRYRVVDGAFHEILMETDAIRAVFWDEFEALVGRTQAMSGGRCADEPKASPPD